MSTSVPPTPPGYHSITPYLIIRDAPRAIDFYKRAFGAVEIIRFPGPGNRIGHAELKFGDSVVMVADENLEMGIRSPESFSGSPVSILLYVPDVDACFNQAISVGAKELRPVRDQFYGDRAGSLLDPFGHQWTLATHIEDISAEEMHRRSKAMIQQQAK